MGIPISSLPAASALTGAELLPVVQSGQTKQTTTDAIPYVPAGTGAVTTTVQEKLRESVSVKDFGAKGDGATDDTNAFKAAIAAVFNEMGGGTVYIPAGDYILSETLNLNNFASDAVANLPVNFTKRLKIVGDGSGSTRLLGGEVGYGFFELIGANFLWFEGFSIVANRSSNYPQYGFCGGRPAGNASSGVHKFSDVFVIGKFSKAAMFMLSSEVNTFNDCVFYPQIGHGCVMAMNNIPWSVTPKYGTFGTGLGGNGHNQFTNVQFLSADQANVGDVPIALEYAQDFRLTSCYWATTNNASQLYFRKSAEGSIENCFFERYGASDPYSIYFSAEDPLDPDDYPQYRDIKISNCRVLNVFADNGTSITNMTVENTVFRGTDTTYHIDLDSVYDSTFRSSNLLPNVTAVTDVKLRIRKEGYRNYYSGFNVSSVSAPHPSLDTFQGSVTDNIDDVFSLENGGVITTGGSLSGAYAQLLPANVPGSSPFSLFVDFECPNIIDGYARVVAGIGGSASALYSTSSVSIMVQNGNMFFRTWGVGAVDDNTYRCTDSGFIAKFAGHRVRVLLIRNENSYPDVYINGYKISITLALQSNRNWTDAVAGQYLIVGFQDSNANFNFPTAYHSAAIFNHAVVPTDAYRITKQGLPLSQQWGGVFGGQAGCNGFWDFASGGGLYVFDQSPHLQTATLSGTVYRSQRNLNRVAYRTTAGSPAGTIAPAYIGEEVLDSTNSNWYKSTGMTNTNWKLLT